MRLVVYTDNQQVTVKRGTRPNGGGLNGDVLKVDGSDFARKKFRLARITKCACVLHRTSSSRT